MHSSNQDNIAFLVAQEIIEEHEAFDYRGHEFEELFDFIFHFASDNLLTGAEAGDAVHMSFYISHHLSFYANANTEKHYIAISKGVIENLNYALPMGKSLLPHLENAEEIVGKNVRQFILEISCKFIFYHEKAHIDQKSKPVDLFGSDESKMPEPVNLVEEFDEDLYAVRSIVDDIITEYGINENTANVVVLVLSALNMFFITMAHDREEYGGESFKPPLHLRYMSCLLYLFRCLADRGVELPKSDIESIINQAKENVEQVCADHLKRSNQKLYDALKNSTQVEKEIQEYAGVSSRFPQLDLSIISVL